MNWADLAGTIVNLVLNADEFVDRIRDIVEDLFGFDDDEEETVVFDGNIDTVVSQVMDRLFPQIDVKLEELRASMISQLDESLKVALELILKKVRDEVKSIQPPQEVEPPAEEPGPTQRNSRAQTLTETGERTDEPAKIMVRRPRRKPRR